MTQACHRDETEAWGDAGYQGVDKRPENRGCGVAWQVAMKPGKRRLLDRDGAEAAAEAQGIGAGEGKRLKRFPL